MKKQKHLQSIKSKCVFSIILAFMLGMPLVIAQELKSAPRPLLPSQSIERELVGTATHTYELKLQKGEFLQIRVEQRGVDVSLKLSDIRGHIVETMDSPNDKEGLETLSHVAEEAGVYVLEVTGFEEKVSGSYSIRREPSRIATPRDRRRVEVERLFVEGMTAREQADQIELAVKKLRQALSGWQELQDDYMIEMTARQIQLLKFAQIRPDMQPLSVGQTVVRDLKSGELHAYLVDLKKGQVLLLNAEKKGVDIIIGLGRDADRALVSSSFFVLSYGRETLTYIVEQSGRYTAVINLAPGSKLTGSYSLSAHVKESADETDRERASAEEMLDRCMRLINQGEKADSDATLRICEASLGSWRKLGETYWQAYSLDLIGTAQLRSGKLTEAFETFNQALTLWREAKDKRGEALTMQNLTVLYLQKNEKRQAVGALTRAADLVRELGDRQSEGTYLRNLASLYGRLGEMARGRVYWLAGNIRPDTTDKGMAQMLFDIGITKKEFGDIQIAKEFLELELIYAAWIKDRYTQASALRNLSEIHLRLGRKSEALKSANAAVEIFQELGNDDGLAFALGYLSEIRLAMGEHEQALEHANRALSLVGPRRYTKIFLWVGEAHSAVGQPKRALAFLNEALLLTKRSLNYSGEARALRDLMGAWRALGNSRLAIFYGKQAVNLLQRERSSLKEMDQQDTGSKDAKPAPPPEEAEEESNDGDYPFRRVYRVYGDRDAQKLFLKTFESIYKNLAELLIEERRLAEAQEVLIALKDQQALDFDPADNTELKPLSANAREAAAAGRYAQMSGEFKNIKSRLHQWAEESEEDTVSIKIIPKRRREISEEDARREDEETIRQLDASMKRFAHGLGEIEADFQQASSVKDEPPDIKVLRELQETLGIISAKTHQKSVAIYQLVGEHAFHTILVTPGDISSASLKIRRDEINKLALHLWGILQSDDYDPTLLSNDFYNIIFKPIESKLPKDTKTIVWTLDDNLRYVPMATLYDGRQYLVERYSNVLFTRMAQARITKDVKSTWTGYGFATSKPHTVEFLDEAVEFAPLDFVREEMQIFRTGSYPRGLVDGEVLSEGSFDKPAFLARLSHGRPLVHISSHFYFHPGNEFLSFLLLGDGSVMSLSEMKAQAGLFKGVELLTLSACDTAAQLPDADGREIDGFAELTQRLGADSVMASLWQVRDVSTAVLMKDFYTKRQGKRMDKAEALRRSQLNLLHGRATGFWDGTRNRGRAMNNRSGRAVNQLNVERRYLIPYKADRLNKPFAHPHYWAPFVLFGNWR